MNKRVFVDFHVIQTVPPSCVNRDDTGSPKSAVYGGVRRARVSSQCWKRAMRLMFRDHFDESDLGVRTKKIVDIIAERIMLKAPNKSQDEAENLAKAVASKAGIQLDAKNDDAKAMFFMSLKQADNLAELILDADQNEKDFSKKAQAALNKGSGVDIALFGRMVASAPSLNADASAQVAHAISTHRVENEFDYFTAVDDRKPDETSGAGMIGTVEFNSSTLYRYATIAVHELSKQLADDKVAVSKTVAEFARAFMQSMPTGKQNTFANRTLPDAVMVTLRHDQPVNLVGAFEEPVSSEGGYVKPSIARLANYANEVYKSFADEPTKTYTVGNGLNEFAKPVNTGELLAALERDVLSALEGI